MKVFFTGGGTAGHVFPALAVHDELKQRYGDQLESGWIGDSRGPEVQLAESAGIPFYGITSGKLRRYISIQNAVDVFRVCIAVIQSIVLLRRTRPQLLFSKGGFVSVPPSIAASLLGIPVVTHESDVTPGLATKIIGKFSQALCVPYEQSKQHLGQLASKAIVTGNPVRDEIVTAQSSRSIQTVYGNTDQLPLILVLGGSQGALEINRVVWQWASEGIEEAFIIHQAGPRTFRPITAQNYYTVPVIREHMGELLHSSSVVISRAGAGAIWEIAAAGRPMILIPKTDSSTRGDQVRNARLFSEQGAAVMLSGSEVTTENLKEHTLRLIHDKPYAESMVQSANSLTCPDGAKKIADTIVSLISR
ncbi:MAG: undecaprenyldiphospho-muramoylpentapeptide beta-N-acetylglucosaminyltransferase [Spirochaetota bacterium]